MAARGNTTARGYGAKHQALRKRVAAPVKAGRAVCWRCGLPIHPWMQWDLGHDDNDRTVHRGPEHSHCNRSSAASRGNRMRGIRKARAKIIYGLDDSQRW
jgi:hypothetical protein